MSVNGNARELALVKAVGAMIKGKVAELEEKIAGVGSRQRDQQITFTPPQIVNRVETPKVDVVNRVETPRVDVTNKVEPAKVSVFVDMEPVAKALSASFKELGKTFTSSIDAMTKSLERLVKEFRENRPLVEVNPVIYPSEVVVQQGEMPAPVVNNVMPKRTRRKLVIEHDDGTRSTVTEE